MPENTKEFTKQERHNILNNLNKKLHPEFLTSRQGFNNIRMTYIEGWQVIELANKIYCFDGWSSEVKNIKIEYSDCVKEGKMDKWSVGVSCLARVTLKNGIFREDSGFGTADNQKMRGQAYEKAKKEAVTDALKRALRQFGSALGMCCYDKEYLKEIQNNANVKFFMRKKELRDEESFDLDQYDTSLQ